jgi:hypothetical protein
MGSVRSISYSYGTGAMALEMESYRNLNTGMHASPSDQGVRLATATSESSFPLLSSPPTLPPRVGKKRAANVVSCHEAGDVYEGGDVELDEEGLLKSSKLLGRTKLLQEESSDNKSNTGVYATRIRACK